MSNLEKVLQVMVSPGIYRVADVADEARISRDEASRALRALVRSQLVDRIKGDGRGRKWLYQSRQMGMFARKCERKKR